MGWNVTVTAKSRHQEDADNRMGCYSKYQGNTNTGNGMECCSATVAVNSRHQEDADNGMECCSATVAVNSQMFSQLTPFT